MALKTAGIAELIINMVRNLTSRPGVSGALVVYMLRAVLAGGIGGRHFLERLMEETRQAMGQALASGLVRPSRDEEARLRYLTHQAIGALMVQFVTAPKVSADEFLASLYSSQADYLLPQLELYTEGLLTSRQLLEDYLTSAREPGDIRPAHT